jgi:ankyrin repeat protein
MLLFASLNCYSYNRFFLIPVILLYEERTNVSNSNSSSLPDELILAIASGRPVTFEDIANAGTDLNASGVTNCRSPLTAAAFAGNSELIKALAKGGAELLSYDKSGNSALITAACEGHVDAVSTLLELGVPIESETKCGTTALMGAAAWGNCQVIKLLLSRGANPHHCNSDGFSALMLAEEKGEGDAVALLAPRTYSEPASE